LLPFPKIQNFSFPDSQVGKSFFFLSRPKAEL